jgi:peptidoglycan/xylan/chitin deacetylase (PgdA/CDA1 family)
MYSPDYLALKNRVLKQFKDAKPGRFGEFVKGVRKNFDTDRKVMAFTFDACGGKHSGYNAELIEYLRREKIRATLFVTGIWIERNKKTFLELASDPLFEIANHGLLHRACSVTGRTKYRVMPTRNIGDVIDEMELNARKIEELTGRRPLFFRSATAFIDELSAKIAGELGMAAVSYNVLSGDALPRTSAKAMARNIIKGAGHGAVVIMHFNLPDRHELDALKAAVPLLRARGYAFDKLKNIPAAAAMPLK